MAVFLEMTDVFTNKLVYCRLNFIRTINRIKGVKDNEILKMGGFPEHTRIYTDSGEVFFVKELPENLLKDKSLRKLDIE